MATDSIPAAGRLTNDAVVLGLLMIILGLVFWTSSIGSGFWKKFYAVVPSLLLCYFLPSLLGTFGVISGDESRLYFVASRYLLPASLVLLTVSTDFPAILRLGPKALIMFITGTVGVIVGGPIALLIVSWINPEAVAGQGPDAVWRGLSTLAGSWIGGGANQAAMKEVFAVGDDLFSALIAVDVIVANIWMGVLLYAAGESAVIDKKTGADTSAIVRLRDKIAGYQAGILRIPKLSDTMIVLAVAFGVTGLSHLGADIISARLTRIAGGDPTHFLTQTSLTSHFFWLVLLATTIGLLLSFSRARKLEGVGASRIGSVLIYVLVATIGMNMNLMAIFEHPWLFVLGAIWISIHGALLIGVGLMIKAPVFMLAVGSQANIGGAASAPIVASAFHPSLAPVGVLLAVLGYALGTYGAWVSAQIMRVVAGE